MTDPHQPYQGVEPPAPKRSGARTAVATIYTILAVIVGFAMLRGQAATMNSGGGPVYAITRVLLNFLLVVLLVWVGMRLWRPKPPRA